MEFHQLVIIILTGLGLIVTLLIHWDEKRRGGEVDDLKSKVARLELLLENVDVHLDPNKPPIEAPKAQEIEALAQDLIKKGGYINTDELIRVGNVAFWTSDYNRAVHYYQVAREQAERNSDRQSFAAILGNSALISQIRGDMAAALKSHEAALKIDHEIGYRQGEAYQLGNIANVCRNRGEFNTALVHLREALTIFQNGGFKSDEARARKIIAEIETEQKKGSTP